MSNEKTIKKELTLIEGIVENSKEIVRIKNVIHLLEEAVYAAAKCKYRLIEHTCLKTSIKEYRMQVEQIQLHNATMMRVAYTSKFLVMLDKFHITQHELQQGYVKISKRSGKTVVDAILFLSDVEPGFLEPIKEGEVREYTDELEKNYLSHCKSLWTDHSVESLYLKTLKKTLK